MKYFSGLTKFLISFLLLLASICSFWLIKDGQLAFAMTVFWGLLFLILILYLAFSKQTRRNQVKKIIASTERVSAKALSVKRLGENSVIIQFLIKNPEKDYIASLVILDADEEQQNKFETGKNTFIYVNPANPYDIVIPEAVKQKAQKSKNVWKTAFWLLPILLAVGLPIYFSVTDNSQDEFHDIGYIWDNKGQGNIWEVRFSDPNKIIITVYDPVLDEKLETIKDKKDNEYDGYADLFICQQHQKVYIIGKGNSPTIDIFDASTFEKLSDIKSFEQTNHFLSNGIASISINTNNKRLITEEVIEITTVDGKICYYNIPQNEFYYSEPELTKSFRYIDSLQMSQQLFAFVLSEIPNSVDKFELNLVQSKNKKSIANLLQLAYSGTLDVDQFNENKKRHYKYCELVRISGSNYYLQASKIYSDSSMAVLLYAASLGVISEEQISGLDKSGMTIFVIKNRDFPNKENMVEDNYSPKNNGNLKCIKHDNKMVFLFAQYGAICIDLTNGNLLWKYEP